MILSAIVVLIIVFPLAYALIRKRSVCPYLILSNMIIFLLVMSFSFIFGHGVYVDVVKDLMFRTDSLTDYTKYYTFITHMFLHADALHILMNMLVLYLMGVPFEERVGTKNFVILYFITGILGAITDSIISSYTGDHHGGIGASGAIFGIMGAFATLYPKDEIPMFLGFIFLQRVPVYLATIVLAVTETAYLFAAKVDNIGHLVHISSLVYGVFLSVLIVRDIMEDNKKGFNSEALRILIKNEKTEEIYKRIKDEEEMDVAEAWISHLVENCECPECGKKLEKKGKIIKCTTCDFQVIYGK